MGRTTRKHGKNSSEAKDNLVIDDSYFAASVLMSGHEVVKKGPGPNGGFQYEVELAGKNWTGA